MDDDTTKTGADDAVEPEETEADATVGADAGDDADVEADGADEDGDDAEAKDGEEEAA